MFCFPILAGAKGNQYGGREYDDLQNWLDMTSHENPLIGRRETPTPRSGKKFLIFLKKLSIFSTLSHQANPCWATDFDCLAIQRQCFDYDQYRKSKQRGEAECTEIKSIEQVEHCFHSTLSNNYSSIIWIQERNYDEKIVMHFTE